MKGIACTVISFATAVMSGLIALHCAQQTLHAQVPNRDYFPTAVGMRWEYDSQFKRILGSVQKSSALTEIKEAKDLKGQKYFVLKTTVEDTPIGDYSEELYYRSDDAAILRTTTVDKAETVFLPHNVKVGDRWETTVAGKSLVVQALALEDVTGADGTLYKDCLKLSTKTAKGAAVDDTTWLAPGVGVVKKSMRRTLYSIDVLLRQMTK